MNVTLEITNLERRVAVVEQTLARYGLRLYGTNPPDQRTDFEQAMHAIAKATDSIGRPIVLCHGIMEQPVRNRLRKSMYNLIRSWNPESVHVSIQNIAMRDAEDTFWRNVRLLATALELAPNDEIERTCGSATGA